MSSDDHRALLGAALAILRDQRRMTQQQLADELGVSVKTINNIENGRTGISVKMGSALEEKLRIGPGIIKGIEITRVDPFKVLFPALEPLRSVGPDEQDASYVATEADAPLPPGTRTITEGDLAAELRRMREALERIEGKLNGGST